MGVKPIDDTNKGRVKRLNNKHNGPIIIGNGVQPRAERSRLIKWRDELDEMWRCQEKSRTNKSATVEEHYSNGKDATVFPDIGGHEKKRRSKKG